MINPRITASKILYQVLCENQSLSDAFLNLKNADPDTGLIKEICFGVCRWYTKLDEVAATFLRSGLKEKDFDIQILLMMGLYQLIYMRIPEHAVVNETVNAAKKTKKTWASGLINGVLRSFLRERQKALKNAEKTDSGKYAHPEWFIEVIQKDWPQQWPQILDANNQRPPFTLRVNLNHIARADYLKKLAEQQIEASEHPIVASAIILAKPMNVIDLPGFVEGWISVQDAAAQLSAQFLELASKQKVLDACAAPGGKTCHILEMQSDIDLLAIDIDPDRTKRITENLNRENLTAHVLVADVSNPKTWWDGVPFDRILLDAPCTAIGVIRRHPDIKLLRDISDIDGTVENQRALLEALWPLLKPNGKLLYATCSILKKENSELILNFLKSHPDATLESFDMTPNNHSKIGLQILPGENGMDGFYFARLSKVE